MLPAAIRKRLPKLYAQESVPNTDKTVYVKFFQPWGRWTWWAVEGEQTEDGDVRFFGFVQGLPGCDEWGYFVLSELEAVRGPGGLRIERDLWFRPAKVSAISALKQADGRTHRGR